MGYNRVHGYYIEVSRLQAGDDVPIEWVRRQTLKDKERFITPELKTFEDKVLSAKERALAREISLRRTVREFINSSTRCSESSIRFSHFRCFKYFCRTRPNFKLRAARISVLPKPEYN